MKVLTLILALFTLGTTSFAQGFNVAANTSGKKPLAKVFAGNDGGAYYVTEIGNKVFWFAEHPGKNYAHVFKGTRSGNTVNGNYTSVPKEGRTEYGQLKFRVNANGTLTRISKTGNFPTSSWKVTSINAIKNILPRKQEPGFTHISPSDADGVFDLGIYRFYVRQRGNSVYFFVESNFKKGDQPDVACVFFGTRSGSAINGQLVPVPKGLLPAPKKVSQIWKFGAKMTSQRKIEITKAIKLLGGTLFGKGNQLIPVLPDIKIPLTQAINVMNGQLNNLQIRLDGYDKDGKPKWNGSFVKFGSYKKTFSIPYMEVMPKTFKRRTFINDVNSDIVNIKTISGKKQRLTVIFEEGGREIKRYCWGCAGKHGDGKGRDNQMKDHDVRDLRVDVEFEFINKTVGGKKTISYKITKVKIHAWPDLKLIPDSFEKWVMSKIMPNFEAKIKEAMNGYSSTFSNLVNSKLRNLSSYVNQYNKSPYSLNTFLPKQVFISGNQVVFRFRD